MNREKVIKALECRKSSDKRCGNPCEKTGFCYYARAIRGSDGEIYLPYVCDKEQICKDAIALLKEQKATRPELIMGTSICDCGKCKHAVAPGMNYCPVCGCRIDWN